MSVSRQTVTLLLNLIGCGNRPDFTPAHQVDLHTGMGPSGWRIDLSLNRRSEHSFEFIFSPFILDLGPKYQVKNFGGRFR